MKPNVTQFLVIRVDTNEYNVLVHSFHYMENISVKFLQRLLILLLFAI